MTTEGIFYYIYIYVCVWIFLGKELDLIHTNI